MASGWKVITCELPDIAAMLRPFEDEMEHWTELALKKFLSSVQTWKRNVLFETEIRFAGSGPTTRVIGEVYTEDEVYGYLNNGTSVRYATMTKNFVAKTKPGRISAKAGAGRVSYVDKHRPRKGIKARKWDQLIAKGTERNLEKAFKRAIDKARKASKHAI